MSDRRQAVYAEDVNYWKTSNKAASTWMDDAEDEIKAAGGKVTARAEMTQGGKTAFLLEFKFGDDTFRAIWEVLESKTKNQRAAKVQAATMLYHDIKNSCVKAKVRGARRAFSEYLLLPGGSTVGQATSGELMSVPPLLALPMGVLVGEVIE